MRNENVYNDGMRKRTKIGAVRRRIEFKVERITEEISSLEKAREVLMALLLEIESIDANLSLDE